MQLPAILWVHVCYRCVLCVFTSIAVPRCSVCPNGAHIAIACVEHQGLSRDACMGLMLPASHTADVLASNHLPLHLPR